MLFDVRCELAGGFVEDWTISGTEDEKQNLSPFTVARSNAETRIRKHYPNASIDWRGMVAFVNRNVPCGGPAPKVTLWIPPIGPRALPSTWRSWSSLGGPEQRTPQLGWAPMPAKSV